MQPLQSRISTSQIEQAYQTIDPVFLNTPQFICEALGQQLSCQIILKVETLNPLRCFKGRGADLLLQNADKKQRIFCASAGNFGQAMAYACRKRKIPLTIYASRNANLLKIERMRALKANVILFGEDFDAAKTEAKRAASLAKGRLVEDSLDIETVIGAGTIGWELAQFPETIDYLLIALGNGALINGIAKVFKEKRNGVKIIACQASGAPAMIESWKTGEVIQYDAVHTIADGIAVRIPVPQALEDMKTMVDEGILVDDNTIIEAMKLIHQHAGLVVEPSAAVGVAAIMEYPEKFKGKSIATIICGSNITREQMESWL